MLNRAPTVMQPNTFESKRFTFGRPPSIGLPRQRSGSNASYGVKQEWFGSAPAVAVWNVSGQDLELVPLDFPLERTHREIAEDATEVAKRITNVLRELSIETEFDDKKGKAKCTTNDYVCFRIRLYAADETRQPVIVEIQRRTGPASSFMRSCRLILDGAEGCLSTTLKQHIAPSSFPKKPLGSLKCLQSVELTEPPTVDPTENVLSMLRSNKLDTNVLGLENLCFLTDLLKTNRSDAVRASKSALLSEDVREEIHALAERDVFVSDNEDHSLLSDKLRHLSLRVMANSLSVCQQDGCLSADVRNQKWFTEHLIPSLLDELNLAATSSNNAFQAACSVLSLVSCSDQAKAVVIDNGGIAILERAHQFALQRHDLLAGETLRCLEIIR